MRARAGTSSIRPAVRCWALLVCPGRDSRVRAGDEVTLIGTPAELAAASVLKENRHHHPERTRGFAPFAIYRIILGAAVLYWAAHVAM